MSKREVKGGTMQLLPAAPGTCPLCAHPHGPTYPHNCQSIFYQMRFNMAHGRGATWADAVAHCQPDMVALWKKALTEKGHWTEPPPGNKPVAEPGGVPGLDEPTQTDCYIARLQEEGKRWWVMFDKTRTVRTQGTLKDIHNLWEAKHGPFRVAVVIKGVHRPSELAMTIAAHQRPDLMKKEKVL